jgi:hypothetical protein
MWFCFNLVLNFNFNFKPDIAYVIFAEFKASSGLLAPSNWPILILAAIPIP